MNQERRIVSFQSRSSTKWQARVAIYRWGPHPFVAAKSKRMTGPGVSRMCDAVQPSFGGVGEVRMPDARGWEVSKFSSQNGNVSSTLEQ